MKKLKLEIDALKVDSFDAGSAVPGVGTVRALGQTSPGCPSQQICPFTVQNDSIFDGSCNLECTGSCGATNCAGDCTHGQTNGATCPCGMTLAPDC
jgi:hypothetical protein